MTASPLRVVRRASAVLLGVLVLAGCSAGPAPVGQPAAGTPSASPAPSSPAVQPSSSTAVPPPPAVATTSEVPAATAALPLAGRIVVLDPGHNGGNASHPAEINAPVPDGNGGTKPCNTTGTESDAGYPEHAFTWDTALRARDLLTAQGASVVLTRSDDSGVGPCVNIRAQISNDNAAAAFVGIHGDGSAADNRGFHVITSALDPAGAAVGAQSASLAGHVRDAVAGSGVIPVSNYTGTDGLVSRSDLAGLNLNDQPAIYIECGNMRNAGDAEVMSSADGRQVIAAALVAGVVAFLTSG